MTQQDFIQWHRTTDAVPDDDRTVLLCRDGEIYTGWFEGDQWRNSCAHPSPVPTWWAHMPDGPEAAT